jgi:hypothetical protein
VNVQVAHLLGLDWIESTSLDFTHTDEVISTTSGVSLVEKVEPILVDFVGFVTLIYTARPFPTLIHDELTYWFRHYNLLL